MTRFVRLDGGETTVVLAIDETGAPRLLHFGAPLPADLDLAELDAVTIAPVRESTPDIPAPATVFPAAGGGFMGLPALAGAADGRRGPFAWTVSGVARSADGIEAMLTDAHTKLRVALSWRLDAETGVLRAGTTLHNDGVDTFRLDSLAALALPLPAWASDIVAFCGDWAREAQPVRFATPPGTWSQHNRSGRTGFAGATFLLAEPGADEMRGRVFALHLAWSGNHRLGVETGADGSRLAFLFAGLERGEIAIAPGASFETPCAYAAFSAHGFNGLSDAFHPFVRRQILPETAANERRVHFNSWEAVYFDFDSASLKALADRAAALGVERFVLDDGWFAGRRNDRAGLGDWTPDPERFPQGLDPLIAHVRALGMDFGLWVEPEMVNPDSALYRRHPDWCVHAPDAPRPTMRHQLWLDLSRADVRDHLFEAIDALLRKHAIVYLKWDCNRTLFPAICNGRPGSYALVQGFYALLDRVRAAHPHVEIESCASGGARIDLEVLRRASRVWPSDSTDAHERLRIQTWTGLLLPPELLGAHVGPSPNPITGRRIDMAFRARVAMFGHMGVELDPARISDADRATLAAHIALYKRHRALLHSGRRLCWMSDDGADCRMILAHDGGQALALAARSGVASHAVSAPIRFPGLDPAARYELTLPEPWPARAARRFADAAVWRAARTFGGAALAEIGVRLPLTDPETAWLVHLQRR